MADRSGAKSPLPSPRWFKRLIQVPGADLSPTLPATVFDMHPTLVILVVGLAPAWSGSIPPTCAVCAQGAMRPLATVTLAVTCTVQSTLATGLMPGGHGAVANGWYFRDLAEVWLWRQSNRLIAGEKIWEAGRRRDPDFTCAKMFWWYNMYATADWSATPRPMYPADGRKIPDHYAYPPELHDESTPAGPFPLFKFWGPAADIASSQWIARATMHVRATRRPTLTLCYLPHLDYNLQRLGPTSTSFACRGTTRDRRRCGELIEQAGAGRRPHRRRLGVRHHAGQRCRAHQPRPARGGLIQVRLELGRELLDVGASRAFALADHQVAHIYLQHGTAVAEVKSLLERLDGVEQVLDEDGKRTFGLDHPPLRGARGDFPAGSLVQLLLLADDARLDFARTVDIHRKPGYDPVELFVDPAIRFRRSRSAGAC